MGTSVGGVKPHWLNCCEDWPLPQDTRCCVLDDLTEQVLSQQTGVCQENLFGCVASGSNKVVLFQV